MELDWVNRWNTWDSWPWFGVGWIQNMGMGDREACLCRNNHQPHFSMSLDFAHNRQTQWLLQMLSVCYNVDWPNGLWPCDWVVVPVLKSFSAPGDIISGRASMGATGALRSLIHLGQSQHSLLCKHYCKLFWGSNFFTSPIRSRRINTSHYT